MMPEQQCFEAARGNEGCGLQVPERKFHISIGEMNAALEKLVVADVARCEQVFKWEYDEQLISHPTLAYSLYTAKMSRSRGVHGEWWIPFE